MAGAFKVDDETYNSTYKVNSYTSDMVTAVDNVSMNFNFKVRLNGITFGFSSVSGIKVTKNFESVPEGGVNDHKIMLGMPQDDNFELTFTRGLMLKASEIVTTTAKAAAALIPNNMARKTAFFALNTLDPQELLESGPALGDIEVYSTTERGKMIGLYSFLALGIKDWSISELGANDNTLMIETFTVAHTGITRMPVAPPAGHYYFKGDFGTYQMRDRNSGRENEAMKRAEETAEEIAKLQSEERYRVDTDKLKAAAEQVAEEMDANSKDSEYTKLRDKNLESLKKIQEKMKEEFGDDPKESKAQKEWKEIREKQALKSEELRKIAREKTEAYMKEAQELTEKMKETIDKNIESVRARAKEFAQLAKVAGQVAQKKSKELAIKLSKFRETQRDKALDLKEEIDRVEQTKFEAMKALELAKGMAQATRENAKELQNASWQKIKEENEKEILKCQEEFAKLRESGLEKTKQNQEERKKREEEYQKQVEEIEKKKAELEQKRQEFMKSAQEIEDEADERAAEAENAADDVEAMIEATK